MEAIQNKPEFAGKLATAKELFGEDSRYAVAAVYTRFDAVQWFVWDGDIPDDAGKATVIRQADSKAEAIAGLGYGGFKETTKGIDPKTFIPEMTIGDEF